MLYASVFVNLAIDTWGCFYVCVCYSSSFSSAAGFSFNFFRCVGTKLKFFRMLGESVKGVGGLDLVYADF